MSVSQANRERYRTILIAREVKAIICGVPERFRWILDEPAKWTLRRFFLRPLLRWLFLSEDGKPHRGGEIVLAQMRRRTGHGRFSIFDPDGRVHAFREGQRAANTEFFNLLNLDENAVHKLMEVDDGLE